MILEALRSWGSWASTIKRILMTRMSIFFDFFPTVRGRPVHFLRGLQMVSWCSQWFTLVLFSLAHAASARVSFTFVFFNSFGEFTLGQGSWVVFSMWVVMGHSDMTEKSQLLAVRFKPVFSRFRCPNGVHSSTSSAIDHPSSRLMYLCKY